VPPNVAGSTAEAVGRILASTEAAVAAIRGRAERQVRLLASDVEARATEEAMERRRHLEQLRQDLAKRAASLSIAYQAINEQLAAVDVALGHWGAGRFGRPPQDDPAPASVEAIKMTLSERQRIAVPYEEAVVPGGGEEVQRMSSSTAVGASQPRRRWWRPWQREAA